MKLFIYINYSFVEKFNFLSAFPFNQNSVHHFNFGNLLTFFSFFNIIVFIYLSYIPYRTLNLNFKIFSVKNFSNYFIFFFENIYFLSKSYFILFHHLFDKEYISSFIFINELF